MLWKGEAAISIAFQLFGLIGLSFDARYSPDHNILCEVHDQKLLPNYS